MFKTKCEKIEKGKMDEVPIGLFFIGTFLEMSFLKDIERSIKYAKAGETDLDKARLRKFRVGDVVTIKCEGRTGVIKKLGAGTATLLVGESPLVYRLEDLVPGKGQQV